ncbi:MAG: hypothetical protein CMJ58_02285 [Planctomycetaceae bacterium]|nr:hypothetical protein [Planctomycetaceae bacterium]
MRILGECCLLVCLVTLGYSVFLTLAADSHRPSWRARLELWSTLLGFGGLSAVLAILAWALAVGDFSFRYVSSYTSQQLEWQYRLAALWVGQAGSLLLWAWLMSACALAVRFFNAAESSLQRTASGLVMFSVWFLVAVMVFAADPMQASLSTPQEGAGLSPLLQHPSMLIHPPVVFMAYALWAVPYALAIATLVDGRIDANWVRMARPWALAAWTLLGVGLLLGAQWAYQELGWGGYWGWDPVENGSLLPWLTGTALIHCLLAWRHSDTLKKTALALAIVTFALCNFATFLTRSGIFSSVHAFSESPIGWMFLAVMGCQVAAAVVLIVRRRTVILARSAFQHVLARETVILMSVFLLCLLAVIVMTGTLCVPLSTMFLGRTIQVGPEFYNSVLPPIGLSLLAAMAAVPLLRWGASPAAAHRRLLAICLLTGGACSLIAFALGMRNRIALVIVSVAIVTVATMIAEFVQNLRRRQRNSQGATAVGILRQGRRKYVAYVVHVGFAMVAIGITGSSLGTQRQEFTLSEGDAITWAGRQVRYDCLVQTELPKMLVAEAVLKVNRGDAPQVELRPARHLHLLQNEWTSEVAIHSTWRGDFYTILHAGLGDGRIVVTLVDNPLVNWIWIGGVVVTIGGFGAVLPTSRGRAAGSKPVANREVELDAAGDGRRSAAA